MRQVGLGRIRASFDGGRTRLTQVSHRAPVRLVPIPSSGIQEAGAAVCALSSYGGGMLPGDAHRIDIQVDAHAKLGVITQGPCRIYKQNHRTPTMTCHSTIHAQVASNGLLVLAGDPCIPFAKSSFQQKVSVNVEPGASAILVDWFGAGRLTRGEQWDFNLLASETILSVQGELLLVDSFSLRHSSTSAADPFGFLGQFNAYCSLVLHGPQAEAVALRLQQLSMQFNSKHTRIRSDDREIPHSTLSLSGRVLLGVSEVEQDGPTYNARVAATCNEDIYRILHMALLPLEFGLEFYRDRIHASQSLPRTAVVPKDKEDSHKARQLSNVSTTCQAFRFPTWRAHMIADSAFPTGSFAHSAGIEAAAQLGLLESETDLKHYIHAALRSSLQQQVPFLVPSSTHDEWKWLDTQLHVRMAANSIACRASLEQGEGLLRVAVAWLRDRDAKSCDLLQEIQESIVSGRAKGHLAPIFGIVCSSIDMEVEEAAYLYGYCAARDMVSATVRLNLIGPLAGVKLLDSCCGAVQEGIENAKQNGACEGETIHASTCAPIVETVHPCHELLSVRLFRS